MSRLSLAILDMNAGVANQGMRCIQEIAADYTDSVDVTIYDVRAKGEFPSMSHDIYISSGGPGNPLEGDGVWDVAWQNWLSDIMEHNAAQPAQAKYVFLICHSYQMACAHLGVGKVTNRLGRSFGALPVYKTHEGYMEDLFEPLPDPFYAVDVRDYQVIDPDFEELHEKGFDMLAIEQPREKNHLPRAVMAVRFSPYVIGTQFHPEADASGMRRYYQQDDKRKETIDTYGGEVYLNIIKHLNDPDKVHLTHATILPAFISGAIKALSAVTVS